MSTLLLNGCSYTTYMSPSDKALGSDLGYTDVVNLSVCGSSNDRLFRSTINYIITHKVDMVILYLTFWHRQEAPWGTNDAWTDYKSIGLCRPQEVSDPARYQQYINDRFKYDVSDRYIEKLLDDIILFSGWLGSKQIKYLILSSPNNFKEHKNTLGLLKPKLDYIKLNPNIIDLENFSANQYMYDQGGQWPETDNQFEPNLKHYTSESFLILNKFIVDYLKNGK